MDSPIVKCGKVWDLHIHSNRCSSAPPEMKTLSTAAYVDGLFEVFEKHRDLDMVSFTDHNSIAFDVYEEFLSRESAIRLLPGVEVDASLSEGEASKHVIVYFDAVDDKGEIAKIAEWLNATLEDVGPKNPIDIDVLLNKLLELRIPFVLSPHAMKQSKRGIDFDWHCLEDPGAEARKYVDQFFCFWETGGKSSIAYAVEFLRQVDSDERVSIISFSDSKDYDKLESYLANPPQYFLSLPSFRGLQMVGSDAHRISSTREEIPADSLGSYLGEICFDGQSIELSTRLNAVIGGRGSGKSLLLDAIALELGASNGKVNATRKEFIGNYAVSIKNACGDVVEPGAFAYDYFNQSYVAKLFMEEGDAYKDSLASYFASGFDAVGDIDEASIKTQNSAAFSLPLSEGSSEQFENISGLVDKYSIDRNDALDIKITKRQKSTIDKKVANLDYGKLVSVIGSAVCSKVPQIVAADQRFTDALITFEREVITVAADYKRDYFCNTYLLNQLVDGFFEVKSEISEAQKAKSGVAKLFEIAFRKGSENVRQRVSIVNAYLESAIGFVSHYENSAVKNGVMAKAFRFKKTLDVEHPLRHMLKLFGDYFLAEKPGQGGFDVSNLGYLIEQFCYDEGGYKKGKDWDSLVNELKKFDLAYTPGVAIEYLCDDGAYRDIATMSPGTQTNILLEYIVHMDTARPLLIDQPEDNVDNQTIFNQIRTWFIKLKHDKQVIVVTHDANIVINSDAENVVIAEQSSSGKFAYRYGALESGDIIDRASLILDGGRSAVKRRLMKYGEKNDYREAV